MADRTQTTLDKIKELGPTISLFTLVVLTITLSVTSQISIGNRLDAMQAENNRRFDAIQAETNRRFDAMQAEDNRRFDELNRRFDELFEILLSFERRISRLEGQASPAE